MKPILVPTDFSDAAFHAARYAWRMAQETGAELHLLNVYHLPNPLKALPIELIVTPDELKSDTESALKQLARALQEDTGSEVRVVLASRNGETRKEVNAYAEFIGASLIVTGMKGKGAVREKLIGSTALDLMRHSRYPVLGVPATSDYNGAPALLFATDGSTIPSKESVEFLDTLLREKSSTLHLGCILSPHDDFDKDAIASVIEPSFRGLKTQWHFNTSDDEIHALEQLAKELRIDWLVILPHKHSLFARLFESNHTRALAFHAGLPVLAIHGHDH